MLFKSVPTGLNTYRLTCSRSKVRVVNKGIEVNVNLTTYLLPTFSNSFYSKFLFALTFLYQYINQLIEINVKKELLHCQVKEKNLSHPISFAAHTLYRYISQNDFIEIVLYEILEKCTKETKVISWFCYLQGAKISRLVFNKRPFMYAKGYFRET